jgi:dTDP-4-dehydrorhamnose reductase
MKVFVTGVAGQLGHDTMNELLRRGCEAIGSDISPVYRGAQDGSPVTAAPYVAMDLTDPSAVDGAMRDIAPDTVVHCAAWTDVDGAEDEDRRSRAYAVNVTATANIAKMCAALNAKMLYVSTDYVFGGGGSEPWRPDCGEFTPCNEYGRTKLEGERAVRGTLDRFFIVRTSWVFGLSGRNFVTSMLNLGQKNPQIRVVNDQIGRPTYAFDLARLLTDLIETEKYGCYHATNEGDFISWYDFAREIFRQAGCSTQVIPVTTAEYGLSKAERPRNSRLDTGKLSESGFARLPSWQDALSRYLVEIKG